MESDMFKLKYSLNLLLVASLTMYALPAEAMHTGKQRSIARMLAPKSQESDMAGGAGTTDQSGKANPLPDQGKISGGATSGPSATSAAQAAAVAAAAAVGGQAPTAPAKATDSSAQSGAAAAPRPTPAPKTSSVNFIALMAANSSSSTKALQVEEPNKSKNQNTHSESAIKNTPDNTVTTSQFKAPQSREREMSLELANQLYVDAPEEIKRLVQLLKSGRNITNKRRLFVGPPGTGKTSLAQAIAKLCGMDFKLYTSSQIANEFQNSGENNLQRIFDEAVNAGKPCIIAIDELQNLIRAHDSKKSEPNMNMLSTLWTQLDDLETQDASAKDGADKKDYKKNNQIFFIGAFNYIDALPEQMQDRFGNYIIEIPLPNPSQRIKTIKYYISQTTDVKFSDEFFETGGKSNNTLAKLTNATDGFSQRSLKAMIHTARETALVRNEHDPIISLQDCFAAIHEIKNSSKRLKKVQTWREWLGTQIAEHPFAAGIVAQVTTGILIEIGKNLWSKYFPAMSAAELKRVTDTQFNLNNRAAITAALIHNAQIRLKMLENPSLAPKLAELIVPEPNINVTVYKQTADGTTLGGGGYTETTTSTAASGAGAGAGQNPSNTEAPKPGTGSN